jgi:hypothetical protein
MSTIVRKKILVDAGGFKKDIGAFSDSIFFKLEGLKSGFVYIPQIISKWNLSLEGDSRKLFLDKNVVTNFSRLIVEEMTKNPFVPKWYPKIFTARTNFAVLRIQSEWKLFEQLSVIQMGKTSKFITSILAIKYKALHSLKVLGYSFVYRPYSYLEILRGYFSDKKNT